MIDVWYSTDEDVFVLVSCFFSLDFGRYILRIADDERASDDGVGCERTFLGGDGVASTCRFMGVDINENGSARTRNSLFQMEFKYAGVKPDVNLGKRYYS